MARIIHTAGLDISGSIFTQVQNNLTASLSISASNDIIADKFIIDKGAATGSSFQVAGDGVLLIANKAGGQINKISLKAVEIDDSSSNSTSFRLGGSMRVGQGAVAGIKHEHKVTGSINILAARPQDGAALEFELNESASFEFLTGAPNSGSFIVQKSPDTGKGALESYFGQGTATAAGQPIPNQIFGLKYTSGSSASEGELSMTFGKRDLSNLGGANQNNFYGTDEPSGIFTNAQGELEFFVGEHLNVGSGVLSVFRGGASGTTQTSSFAGYFSSSAFPNQQQYTRPFAISATSTVDDSNPAFVINKNVTDLTTSNFSVDYGGNVTASGLIVDELRVRGVITAQEFHTELVSSSIIFHSGSTKFVDTVDDTHLFTVSVDITGDLKAGKLFIDEKAAIDTYVGLGNELTLNPDDTWDAIRLNSDGAPQPIILNGFVTASRTITVGSTANSEGDRIFEITDNEGAVRVFYESQRLLQLGANEPVVRMGGSSTQFQLTGSMVTNGIISASGDITGNTGSFNRIYIPQSGLTEAIIDFNGGSRIGGNAQAGTDLLLSATDDMHFGAGDDVVFYSASLPDNDIPSAGAQWLNFDKGARTLTFGPAANEFIFNGNISASGDIIGNHITASNKLTVGTPIIDPATFGYTGLTSTFNGGALFVLNSETNSVFGIHDSPDGADILRIDTDPDQFIIDPINNGYNVGIGTGTPTEKLTILGNVSASGNGIFKAGKPITTHTSSPISSSYANAGGYHIVGGNLTASIVINSSTPVGAEYEFFQSSSTGQFLFESASGTTVISKNGSMRLAQQGSSAVLKKVSSTTFHLMGDLT